GRLTERLGQPEPGLAQLGLSHTFPSADTLAKADLGGLGLTRARAAAVRSFARAVTDGTVPLDRSVDLDRLAASITALEGLGPWTAQYLALRLGEPDACPITDLGLRRALHRVTGAAPAEVAERWRPWRALATTPLWLAEDAGHSASAGHFAARR